MSYQDFIDMATAARVSGRRCPVSGHRFYTGQWIPEGSVQPIYHVEYCPACDEVYFQHVTTREIFKSDAPQDRYRVYRLVMDPGYRVGMKDMSVEFPKPPLLNP